jgi:hypothetical protein
MRLFPLYLQSHKSTSYSLPCIFWDSLFRFVTD